MSVVFSVRALACAKWLDCIVAVECELQSDAATTTATCHNRHLQLAKAPAFGLAPHNKPQVPQKKRSGKDVQFFGERSAKASRKRRGSRRFKTHPTPPSLQPQSSQKLQG